MSRNALLGASLVALAILTGVCYGPAIVGGQFAFRDAAHFYYPLYQRVEAEWDAGRWPLWEPEENGGMPLVGNPTAAVLYPGKVLYRVMPYPLAARWYVIAHTLLAFAGAVALARSLGIGGVGAAITGAVYAFGAPVLFQYCNIIYLVGAAWLPCALAAVDAWLRRGKRWGIAALGVALTMQVLGGDPQSAYLAGLCAGGYALLLARAERERPPGSPWRGAALGLAVVAGLIAWVVVTLALARVLPHVRPKALLPPTPTFWWNRYIPMAVAACWGLAGLRLVARWRGGRGDAATLGRRLAGLAAAAALAGLLAAAQLLPVVEFAGRTGRAADEGSHDIYPFSLEPYRVVEMLLPNVFGTMKRINTFWLNLVPPTENHKIWVDSLYLGEATLVLALVGMGGRSGPPWRRWMVGVAAVSLIAGFGEFLGPIRVAREFPAMVRLIGPQDQSSSNAIRLDGFLRDGDGSPYHLLSVALPGFQQFRYPSKLLTLTVLALAVLAGHGWDRVEAGARRAALRWGGGLLAVAATAAVAVALARGPIVARFSAAGLATVFGPLDAPGAYAAILGATLHASAALAAFLVALWAWGRRPRAAAVAVLLIIALDLSIANRHLISVTDQAEFDRVPKAIEIIAEAEKAAPANGPYRIHRMPLWRPDDWRRSSSTDRYTDFVRWERDTIQPKYGLPYGVEYTFTQGVAELYDYEWFFAPWTNRVDPVIARRINLDPSERAVYYPRRGFDMWGTRYFILPGIVVANSPDRGVSSLTTDVERIYPRPDAFDGPDGARLRDRQLRGEDLQILRNRNALPRAWVVHTARFSAPIEGLAREKRKAPMEEMLYMADPLWNDPDRHASDPLAIVWMEVPEPHTLNRFLPGGPTPTSEAVAVRPMGPARVELDVTLERPGIVVLADVFYPGWTLTIDGKPAPILRANRMMRGAAVESGPHRLVYEYRPNSFAVGRIISLLGLVALGGALAWSRRRPKPAGEVAANEVELRLQAAR